MNKITFQERESYRRHLKTLRDNLTYAYRHRHRDDWVKRARYSLWRLRNASLQNFLEDNFLLSKFADNRATDKTLSLASAATD